MTQKRKKSSMTEIHVSIQNQEAGNGSIESPYSSIQAAYDAVVNLKSCGLLTLPVTIYVHEGVYHIQKALSFRENLPVTIRPSCRQSATEGVPVSSARARALAITGRCVSSSPMERISILILLTSVPSLSPLRCAHRAR